MDFKLKSSHLKAPLHRKERGMKILLKLNNSVFSLGTIP